MKNILVVDDIEENRYMLTSLLLGNGYHVVAKANGDEALKWAIENPPDLVISDILMPIMDGFELCRKWKKDENLKSIPFIIYTATYTDEKDERLALELGADKFIVKPQKPEVLLKLIQEIISDFEKQKEMSVAVISTDELSFLRQHQEALVRKLSRKLEQLESEISNHKRTMQFLNSIIENIPHIIFIKDAKDLSFVCFNKTAEDFLGITRKELIGKNDYDIFPSEVAEFNEKTDREILKTGMIIDIPDMLIQNHCSGLRHVHIKKIPIREQRGEIAFILGIAEDITELKRLEDEKHQLQQQIWQSQKLESIGRFAGSIAHDFNNHLSVIMGYANLLLDTFNKDDTKRVDIIEILRAGESASSLSKKLLTFSKKQVLQCMNVDLNKIVSDLKRMLCRLIPENIIIDFLFSDVPAVVYADPVQIEQIIMNLVLNARDAMPAGGKIVIAVKTLYLDEQEVYSYEARPGNFVLLSVNDTGIGMDEETISHIFEPFYTTKEDGKGTGLGLATVYGIVRQSGGFIHVETKLGLGTSMNIFLPEAKSTAVTNFVRKKMNSTPSNKGIETILIVEDNEAVLRLMEKILISAGYQVVATTCCANAKHYLYSMRHIDALICDVVLPDGKGCDFYMRMRNQFPHLKSLFISGYVNETIPEEIVCDKKAKMIYKPFSAEDLKVHIRNLLDQK